MAVYALYVPTAKAVVTGIRMERFASREVTARELKRRNHTRSSQTFYVDDGCWAPAVFPGADATGYLRVFLRRAKDPVPYLLDTPDEEWIVREGGRAGVVERLPWTDGPEKVAALKAGLRVRPFGGASGSRSVLSRRSVRCDGPSCPMVFAARTASHPDFIRLYRRYGWRMKGSMTGPVHFCPDHVGT